MHSVTAIDCVHGTLITTPRATELKLLTLLLFNLTQNNLRHESAVLSCTGLMSGVICHCYATGFENLSDFGAKRTPWYNDHVHSRLFIFWSLVLPAAGY